MMSFGSIEWSTIPAMLTLNYELRSVVTQITGLPNDVSGTADLYSELGVASIKAIQLLMAIEEHFGINVPDDQFIEATSVERLIEMVSRLTQTS
jgi:acyl carrier protein